MITITQLNMAKNNAAWKTNTMRGYLFKTELPAQTWGAGAYKLTFREAENDTSGSTPVPKDHDFYFNVDTNVYDDTIPNDTTLDLDIELLGHILNASWQSFTKDECEIARVGTGGKW